SVHQRTGAVVLLGTLDVSQVRRRFGGEGGVRNEEYVFSVGAGRPKSNGRSGGRPGRRRFPATAWLAASTARSGASPSRWQGESLLAQGPDASTRTFPRRARAPKARLGVAVTVPPFVDYRGRSRTAPGGRSCRGKNPAAGRRPSRPARRRWSSSSAASPW